MSNKFYGVKISDSSGEYYYTEIQVKQNLTHKSPVSSVVPLGSKCPYHTKVGKANYWVGTISAAWENNTESECKNDCTFGDVDFRIRFISFLHNGLTKYLQLSESFILPVVIMEDISVSPEFTIDDSVLEMSFSWEQCDDAIISNGTINNCSNCGKMIAIGVNYCPNCGGKSNK